MTAVSTQSFYVEQVREVTVIDFAVQSIDEHNFEFVSDELFEIAEYLMSTFPIRVVVDLSKVRQMDDWGLAMLRAFQETIDNHNGTVIFCRVPQSVTKFMSETGFTNGFQICDSQNEALRLVNN